MTFTGRVENGVVILEPGAALPDGTLVSIQPLTVPNAGPPVRRSLYDILKPVVGAAQGLPPDFAENHDHYIHGTSKR